MAGRRGFTLLELIVTMVVLVILMLIALPSFERWQASQRMKAAIHALHQDLLAARSQSITLGAPIVVCPGTPVSGCRGDSRWSQGWLTFHDLDGDRQFDRGEALFRTSDGFERLHVMSAASRPSVRFLPNGTAPGSNGSIWFCGVRGPESAQRLVVSNQGRIRREGYPYMEPGDCPET